MKLTVKKKKGNGMHQDIFMCMAFYKPVLLSSRLFKDQFILSEKISGCLDYVTARVSDKDG